MERKLQLQLPTTLCVFSKTLFLIKKVCKLTIMGNDYGQNGKKDSDVREAVSKYKCVIVFVN